MHHTDSIRGQWACVCTIHYRIYSYTLFCPMYVGPLGIQCIRRPRKSRDNVLYIYIYMYISERQGSHLARTRASKYRRQYSNFFFRHIYFRHICILRVTLAKRISSTRYFVKIFTSFLLNEINNLFLCASNFITLRHLLKYL